MRLKPSARMCAIVLYSTALFTAGSLITNAPSAAGQAPAPQQRQTHMAPATTVTIDGSEAMFTTMAALYAAGYEGDISADSWSPFRAQMRERLRNQQGPAVEAVREFYRKHQLKDPGEMLSRYVWFGLVAGPAPKFSPVLRRDELPPEMIALDGFSEILADYYKEQKIGDLWRQVQPVYNREIGRLHEPISQTVLVASAYVRQLQDSKEPETFTVVIEPLVGRITNVRNFADHYAIVLSGNQDIPIDVIRHAFLHFLIDPLPLTYPHVIAVKRPLFDTAAKAPRLAHDLRDDFNAWFTENLVRAVELKVRKLSPGEREAAMDGDDASGYTLVRPIFKALGDYEKAEPSLKLYFPDLIRSIDLKTEQAREAGITFAPAEAPKAEESLSAEDVVKKRGLGITTVPNDQDAIASLTEGERRIAEKNPRAAEAAFKKVLAKYPDQTRAWYGLGLVALMDGDGARAKEIFGRLTTGDHAATQDPMVTSWSHVYLARVYRSEGDLERAKTEYQAALKVDGAPAQAHQAAEREIAAMSGAKTAERP